MKNMEQRDKAKPNTLRTIAELCLLMGLGLTSLSQILFMVPWDMLVFATGAIVFVLGYIGIKLLAEKEKKGWSISEVILILGFTLLATGIFMKQWILTALGTLTLATRAIPHIVSFMKGMWSYYTKTYREISQEEQEQMGREKHV